MASQPPAMSDNESSIPIFRPAKRRKVNRPPRTSATPDLDTAAAAASGLRQVASTDQDDTQEGTSQADSQALKSALRARNKLKGRKTGGISASHRPEAPSETALVLASANTEDAEDEGGVFAHRFARPKGLVEDVMDKAMAAYIDSRLDTMKSAELLRNKEEQEATVARLVAQNDGSGTNANGTTGRQATTAGKLQEIDLGPSTAQANALRTAAARNGNLSPSSIDVHGKKQKPRKGLGPDGKPWRKRRSQRTEDDLKRDALVESIMAEAHGLTPLNPADATSSSKAVTTADDFTAGQEGQDADESMMLAFQRDYFDAQQSRQARKPPPLTGKDKEAELKLKGPRLGGSRSARAAMHKSLQDAEAKKKGK